MAKRRVALDLRHACCHKQWGVGARVPVGAMRNDQKRFFRELVFAGLLALFALALFALPACDSDPSTEPELDVRDEELTEGVVDSELDEGEVTPLPCAGVAGECPSPLDFGQIPARPRLDCVDVDAPAEGFMVGAGREAFEAAGALLETPIENGPQGGFHIYGALRFEGATDAPIVERVYWITTCASCGDNVEIPQVEECEPDLDNACTAECTSTCGDGIIDASSGEQCDDAGRSETCNTDCTLSRCGDGIVNRSAGELCEPRSPDDPFCTPFCTRPRCGDGILTPSIGEECDDGNANDDDFCTNRCELQACPDCPEVTDPVCGDGVVEGDEACEPDQPGCTEECTRPTCGDDVIEGDEECDDGPEGSATCTSACTFVRCGDGIVTAEAGEVCDAGPRNGRGSLCAADCSGEITPECGNGVLECGEACDDGPAGSATCSSDCERIACEETVVAQTFHPEREAIEAGGTYEIAGDLVIFSALSELDAVCMRGTLHALAVDANCNFYYDSVPLWPQPAAGPPLDELPFSEAVETASPSESE